MCAFDSVEPATLSHDETRRFGEILNALSESLLSENDVETERQKERDIRDIRDRHDHDSIDDDVDRVNEDSIRSNCYRVFRSNSILGQVLRNKYGILEIERVEEIIETIADGGLRLINSLLKDEKEIEHRAYYYHKNSLNILWMN